MIRRHHLGEGPPRWASARRESDIPARREAGFTLIELVVVLGLLSSFLLMLVQLLSSGVEMFSRGQRGQDLADRAHLASHAIREVISPLAGPVLPTYEDHDPEVRMLVHHAPLGFAEDADPDTTIAQVMRATVALSETQEEQMLAEFFRQEAEEAGGDEEAVSRSIARLVAEAPRQGRASAMFAVWPMDSDGVFLELRHGLYSNAVDLQDIPIFDVDPGTEAFPTDLFLASTVPVLSGLLHIEFALWSQETRSWEARPGSGGPEHAWDSTRSGRLLDLVADNAPRAHQFGLDLGPSSLRDLRDDVFPRALRVTVVVSRSQNEPPDAFLEESISTSTKSFRVNRAEDLPLGNVGGWLKIGSEWVSYEERNGRTVRGLKRGLRGTVAKDHKRGVGIRVGKTVTLFHRVVHGRDGGVSGDN